MSSISWNAADQVDALKHHMGAAFAAIAKKSADSPPPGVNAANGFFRNAVANDADISEAVTGENYHYTDPESASLYVASVAFFDAIRKPFRDRENHGASVATSPGAFISALTAFSAQIVPIVTDIVSVFIADPAARAAAAGKVKTDIDALIEEVKKKRVLFKGEHANGWIASDVNGAAAAQLTALSALHPATAEGQAYLATLVQVATKLRDIPLDNFEPWLNSDWQLHFQAVMDGGAAAMTTS